MICAKLEALACWGGDCETYVAGTVQQAAATGCKAQAQTAFDCIEGDTPFCDPSTNRVQYGTACQTAINAYFTCLQGTGQCTQAGFIGPCSVMCDIAWGAECTVQAGNSYWDCICRTGPQITKKFTLSPADKCSETLAGAQCK